MNKKIAKRLKRAVKPRANIRKLNKTRLCVHRSNTHIYAQLITPCGGKVITAASTLEKVLREQFKNFSNKIAAAAVGRLLAERAIAAGVKQVAFDRSGYKYHGRIRALADAAREAGLDF